MQTPLKVVELSKDFNDKNAVKNISFEVKQNEIVGSLALMAVEKPQPSE